MPETSMGVISVSPHSFCMHSTTAEPRTPPPTELVKDLCEFLAQNSITRSIHRRFRHRRVCLPATSRQRLALNAAETRRHLPLTKKEEEKFLERNASGQFPSLRDAFSPLPRPLTFHVAYENQMASLGFHRPYGPSSGPPTLSLRLARATPVNIDQI